MNIEEINLIKYGFEMGLGYVGAIVVWVLCLLIAVWIVRKLEAR